MTIDERIEALTMNLELLSRDRERDNERIKLLVMAADKDGENIRGLVRLAEIHQEEHKQLNELHQEEHKQFNEAWDKRIGELVSAIGELIAAQTK